MGIEAWYVKYINPDELTVDSYRLPLSPSRLRHNNIQCSLERIKIIRDFVKTQCIDVGVIIGDTRTSLDSFIALNDLGIPVAHIESGLRSFDIDTLEEIYRWSIDERSQIHFCTEPSAIRNLQSEGTRRHLYEVGSLTIDALSAYSFKNIKKDLDFLITIHRRENVESDLFLNDLQGFILKCEINKKNYAFVSHPSSRKYLKLDSFKSCKFYPAQSHKEFLNLLNSTKAVITDSGGLQEETSFLGIPCFTVRKATERPITTQIGTNRLCRFNQIHDAEHCTRKISSLEYPYWDGNSSQRIARILKETI